MKKCSNANMSSQHKLIYIMTNKYKKYSNNSDLFCYAKHELLLFYSQQTTYSNNHKLQ